MQFTMIAALACASLVTAENLVTFMSMDDTDRTVVWTPNAGLEDLEDTSVPAGQNVTVTVPQGWIGNNYAYADGADNVPGMLAEFAFNSWADLTYFDVSAIVNPDDTTNIFQMYPADTESPISGCNEFACDNAYYWADAVQTKATLSTHIVVTLGAGPMDITTTSKRDSQNFPRAAVTDPNFKPNTVKGRFSSALRWARRN